MPALGYPSTEFRPRIDHRVDFPSEPRFRCRERVRDFGELGGTDDQQIDIALGTAGSGGDRSEERRRLDPIGERSEGGANHVGRPHGLLQETAEVREHGR